MDSSYFLKSNSISTRTNSTNNISNNNDFDLQSSSPSPAFNYDSFDGFSLLDQHNTMRLYDYFGAVGAAGGGGGGGYTSNMNTSSTSIASVSSPSGRNSPITTINHWPSDQLDLQHQKCSFPFRSDPIHNDDVDDNDDDDLQETLNSFVGGHLDSIDLDPGYNSSVDLFATNPFVDCSDSAETYYFKLSLDQSNNINSYCNNSNNNNYNYNINNNNNNNFSNSNNNYSDINNNYNNISDYYDCDSYNSCNGDSNIGQVTEKRSVLMNLLIDGSDVGAGYTSHNCRALTQKMTK